MRRILNNAIDVYKRQVVNGTSMEEPPEGSVVTQDQVDRDMEQLYQAMAEYFQQENMMEKVSIGKGNGYVFISFNDTVFFRPNEYTDVYKRQGRGDHHCGRHGL